MTLAPRPRPHLLPDRPAISSPHMSRLEADHDRFAREGLPDGLERYILQTYGVDVEANYGPCAIKNPWGKASGQLTMNLGQVAEAAASGLGFVVLKTVIAQNDQGGQSMSAWAIKESRMVVEPIVGRDSGETGWTVTWKGRGWWLGFSDYLDLVRESTAVGLRHGMLVAPSVKYHLPGPDETEWRTEEYEHTTRALVEAYRQGGGVGPMLLEKDFSPTLAGSDRSRQRQRTHEWLRKVPGLIREGARPDAVIVGLKLFNSLDGEDEQRALLDSSLAEGADQADFLIYANRLFDPVKEFDGHVGVAYGGPDLSDRNLRVLSQFRRDQATGQAAARSLPISATGDILTGKMAAEYALRGCSSFQMHTLFQLPADQFAMTAGNRVERALHRLYFDPNHGLIAWLLHAGRLLGLGETVRLRDVASRGAASAFEPADFHA